MPIDWSKPPPTGPGKIDWSKPPGDAAPPKSAVGEVAESFADVPREIGHEFMESSRALQRDETAPTGESDVLGVGGVTPRMLRMGGDILGQAGAPLRGLATSVLGRPIQTGTGIPKETTGNIALMLIPGAGELIEARQAAQLAKSAGISLRTAKLVLSERAGAAKTAADAAGAAKRAAARPVLNRNVRALQQIGAAPSLAVASTSKGTRGLTQSIGGNWFIGAPIRQAVNRTARAFQERAASTGALQPAASGERVQRAVERFANTPRSVRAIIASRSPATQIAAGDAVRAVPSQRIGFGVKADNLYGRATAMVPQGAQAPMTETQGALADLMHKFRNPGLSEQFANPTLRELNEHLAASDGRLSFDDARRLRTEIRQSLMNDPQLRTKINDAEVNRLYDAMSRDLHTAAGRLGGPQAAKAWGDADKFYRAGTGRIESALDRYYGRNATPASVFHDMLGAAQGGARQDLDRLNQVRRSLPPDEWATFQASVLDRMGRALPGQATEETPFSMRTFLTNVNKLEAPDASGSRYRESGLRALFGRAGEAGASTEQEQMVRDLRHVASQWRELEKLENVSRSGDHAGNIASGIALGTAAINNHPLLAITGLISGNAASGLLGDPTFVKWLAGIPKDGTPAQTQSAVKALSRWLPVAAGADRQASQ